MIGDRVREAREAAGVTQSRLAMKRFVGFLAWLAIAAYLVARTIQTLREGETIWPALLIVGAICALANAFDFGESA